MDKIKEKKKEYLYYFLIIIFTFGIGYFSLGEGFNFDVYCGFAGDSTFGMTLVKAIDENGPIGVWFNSRLGAPESSTLIEYPVLGNMMVIILWIISWFTNSASRIMYLYLIISFALDGVSMSLLLRKLKINREASFVISCLFAAAPYHFYRYLAQSSLINYMYVPIAIYLSLVILDYFENEKKWKIIVSTILLGLGYGYYYAFGLILLAVSCIIKFIKLQDKKKIIYKLWVIGLLLCVIVITLLPKFIYTFFNGVNTEVGHRFFFEQEMYGLKIINLLLPVSYSRIDFLRELTTTYISSGAPLVNENVAASLGLIGTIGFIVLCISFFISFVGKSKYEGKEWELIDFLSLGTLVFVLTGTIGGFGEIFNWAITSQIRCYNRSSIFIMGLSMLMIAILLNKLEEKGKKISILVCILVLIIGCYDQINISAAYWQRDTIEPVQVMYESYFEEVEDSLGENAMVYQLPYMDFPEAGTINGISDYKHFIGYLFTDTLNWSYGAVRGRNLTAKELNIDEGMSYEFLLGIKNAGFDAVYIDLDGYADGGNSILAFYNSLGLNPIISGDGKLYTYDISNLEISQGWLKPGYSFVLTWANKYDLQVEDTKLIELADGLENLDNSVFLALYEWCAKDDIVRYGSDEEYVDYLYQLLLNREADQEGKEAWVASLQNGSSRENIFCSFLSCDEFRSGKGLMENN